MKFSRPEHEEISLNLAPLIDVVFLLLIFFMVTASFKQNSAIDLTLPEANPEKIQPQYLTLKISINDRDEIILKNGQTQFAQISGDETRDALANKIQQAIKQHKHQNPDASTKTPTIVIEADKRASHGRVVQLMDAISKLGINKIQFAVEPEQS